MRERVQKIFIFLAIFIVCFFITQNLIEKFNVIEKLPFIEKENVEYINKMKTVVNGILSFIVVNVFNIIQVYSEKRKENEKEMPIATVNNRAVTCMRKNKKKDGMPEILLGEGNCFIYVISELKNVGAGTIEQCSVANQKLDIIPISSNEEFGFCFRICRNKNEECKEKYKFDVEFKDSRKRCYITGFELYVNENNQTADVKISKKQRRSY